MVSQAHPCVRVRSHVIHLHEQSARDLYHPPCGQNERMPVQVHPQEGFVPESLARPWIGQQLVAERLDGAYFSCFTVIYEICHAEPALAQNAVNLVLATNDITLLVDLGSLLSRSLPPR